MHNVRLKDITSIFEYDDVANEQRKIVYEERNNLMGEDNVSDNVQVMREEVLSEVISRSIPPESIDEQWDIDKSLHEETLRERILKTIVDAYSEKEERHGDELMRHLEKVVMLQILDTQWKEHLAEMDYLRKGIGLRSYAQKNPKQEYKREAFEMFTAMLDRIKFEVVSVISKVEIQDQADVDSMEQRQRKEAELELNHASADSGAAQQANENTQVKREGPKVGRNEPCPCGSGKKYKHCHGKLS